MYMQRVSFEPRFQDWLGRLSEANIEVFGEVMALITSLEEYGRQLGDPYSHPLVSSAYDLHALRRTPPTEVTPYATGKPVLRIIYGYAISPTELVAVLLVGGDKAALGNHWYPPNITTAEERLRQWCRHNNGFQPIIKRGGVS